MRVPLYVVESAKNGSVSDVGDEDCQGSAVAVVESHETRWLQHTRRARSGKVGSHSRMQAWERGEDGHQDKSRMRHPHQSSEPPCSHAECMEEEHVDERNPPAVNKVNNEPDDLRPITIGRDHRSEDEGDIHPCEMQCMTRPKNGGQ